MKEIRETIQSNDSRISGTVCYPDKEQDEYSFLAILHGIPSPEGRNLSVEEKGYLEICTPYCDHGFIVALFNFQGCKGSSGKYSPLGWVQNVKDIFNHVQEHEPRLNPDHAGILSFSAGAMITPYFAARDSRPKFLVCAAPPADLNPESAFFDRLLFGILMTFADQKLKIREIKKQLVEINPLTHVKQVKAPILIVHGEKDELISKENAIKLHQAANNPKELMLIPNGGHKLHRDSRVLKIIFNWIINQVKRP
ncbi:MAG: alpha/beta hydrolase family protein [Candidatus Helarchaeota archaeon]